ncbi:DUF4376 domain-containing protein [Pseudomonas sp. LJDD11]|uniref:DUF4376 domain-containing protein n=1 Tax=Pseudomonas sp. LJDD11 TaxID=2931984 RepID=UPI00211C7411|nr:DUF4376 domain-containing protein [Pseudomonas sp. LJDD11]MCQ9423489.1 DUF4376 domain-containing protein [Pseudomonas sp. LJDD11]
METYVYLWDSNKVFTSAFKVEDPLGPVPAGTATEPPKLADGEFAQWDGLEWSKLSSYPVPVLPEPPVPDWPALIAARRYQAETAGITFEGMAVATDDRSQTLITGAALQALIDPEYSLQWKTATGFVQLTGQQILALASTVRAHVQACFDREAELQAAVAEGSITTELLEQGWP